MQNHRAHRRLPLLDREFFSPLPLRLVGAPVEEAGRGQCQQQLQPGRA
jgi:hypothetical protein